MCVLDSNIGKPGRSGQGNRNAQRNSSSRQTLTAPSTGLYALGGHFETKFARMKYTGAGLFELAFMRYTGEWFEVFAGLTLDACLAIIRDDVSFHP
jgi:hypothetical protein